MPQRRAQATTKRSRMPQRRPHVPQLRPDAAKKKKKKEKKKINEFLKNQYLFNDKKVQFAVSMPSCQRLSRTNL